MLGSYLLSSGFEHPEIHAKLGGQSIVVNLVSPEISGELIWAQLPLRATATARVHARSEPRRYNHR